LAVSASLWQVGRVRLAVRWHTRDKRLEVGFRATASQDIVAIDQCLVLVQPLQTLLPGLLEALHGLTKPQAIGHVELFSGTAEAVLIRHTAPLPEIDLARLRAFARAHQAQLWLQGEGEPQADVPGRRWATALRPGTWSWPGGREISFRSMRR